jgi:RNA polymerase sigma-70 factor (ECF subfamily)
VAREAYVGLWLPEPVLSDVHPGPEESVELAESLSIAFLVLLESLSPLERAVFLLREVFGFEYEEISQMVGRSKAACRQLVSRAHRHLGRKARGSGLIAPEAESWPIGSSPHAPPETSPVSCAC